MEGLLEPEAPGPRLGDRGLPVALHHREQAGGLRRGDDMAGSPHRAQIYFSIRVFRAYSPIEIRQTILYRAIRGNRFSVNSVLPPLKDSDGTSSTLSDGSGPRFPGKPRSGKAAPLAKGGGEDDHGL